MSVSHNMEIRNLDYNHKEKLAAILDNNDSWKSLMAKIPKDLDAIRNGHDSMPIPKYNVSHIRQIDEICTESHGSPTIRLIEEWGTSGRKRATVNDLKELLVSVHLYRAADYVAEDILKIPLPKRPDSGPGARIDITLPSVAGDNVAIENLLQNIDYPSTARINNDRLLDTLVNNQNINNNKIADHVKSMPNQNSLEDITSANQSSSEQSSSDRSESNSFSSMIKFSTNKCVPSIEQDSNPNPEILWLSHPGTSQLVPLLNNGYNANAGDVDPQISKQYEHSNSYMPDFNKLNLNNDTNSFTLLSTSNKEDLSSASSASDIASNQSSSVSTYIPNLSVFNGNDSRTSISN